MNNPTVPITVTFLVALGLGYTVIFIVMGSFFNYRYQELVKELRAENRLLKGQLKGQLARRVYTPPTLRLVEPPFPDAYPEAYIETGYDTDDDIDDAPTVTDHMTDHWTDNPPVAHPPN